MFSLPDIRHLLHTRLSAAIGHLIDLDSLDEAQFQVSLSGMTSRVELREVALKDGVAVGASPAHGASSLSLRTLPGGRLGAFSVSVPLSTLVRKTQKIEVCLHGLEVVVGVEDAVGMEEARTSWMEEERRLMEGEASSSAAAGFEGTAASSANGANGPNGAIHNAFIVSALVKRMLSMGVARLQLDVRDVRVRVVDMKTGDGVVDFWVDRVETVESVGAESGAEGDTGAAARTDGGADNSDNSLSGVPPPLDGLVEGLVRSGESKIVRVEGIGMRWSGSVSARRRGRDTATASTAGTATGVQLDCTLHALYNITAVPSQVLLRVRLGRLDTSVDMEEAGDIMALAEDMEWRGVRRRVAHLRPADPPSSTPTTPTTPATPATPATSAESVTKLFDARAMWQFAINSVLLEMAGPLRFAAWRPENEVVRDRRRYVLLYRKMHDVRASMSTVGEREIARLEERLSVSDVVACRAVAMRAAGVGPAKHSTTASLSSSSSSYSASRENQTVNPNPNPNASAAWSKIPALAEMEEQLFRALEVDDASAFGDDEDDEDKEGDQSGRLDRQGNESTIASPSKLQMVAVVQVPRATTSNSL